MTFLVVSLGGCSTATITEAPTLPEVPEYVKTPHPVGYENSDLKALFFSPLAPQGALGEFTDTCDDEFKRLSAATQSRDDKRRGAIELVTMDPERMHWCFYGKLTKLHDVLGSDATWSARQKKVIETYNFLGPIGLAFMDIYSDSRYTRWASQYYSKISEWIFFRKVATTEENTLWMVNHQKKDLEPWVPLKPQSSLTSVFTKYGITLSPVMTKPEAPVLTAEPQASDQNVNRIPASAPENPSPPASADSELVPGDVIPELPPVE